MVTMQELIWIIKPDLVIETGITQGGSLIMSASMLVLLDVCVAIESGAVLNPKKSKRKVVGLDIDIRQHNREAIEVQPTLFSRIQMIQGSIITQEIIEKVKVITKNYQRVLVCLQSHHTYPHVLAKFEVSAPSTRVGSYFMVFDTVVQDMSKPCLPTLHVGRATTPKQRYGYSSQHTQGLRLT
jgi:cephalosporin hydroxylase